MGFQGLPNFHCLVSIFPNGDEPEPTKLVWYPTTIFDELANMALSRWLPYLIAWNAPCIYVSNGWANRDLISFYERYVRTVLPAIRTRSVLADLNEINSVLHMRLYAVALPMPAEELLQAGPLSSGPPELVYLPWQRRLVMRSILILRLAVWPAWSAGLSHDT